MEKSENKQRFFKQLLNPGRIVELKANFPLKGGGESHVCKKSGVGRPSLMKGAAEGSGGFGRMDGFEKGEVAFLSLSLFRKVENQEQEEPRGRK